MELLSTYVDLSLVYSSSVDFGLCTYSLKNRSSLKVWRSDIPKDQFFSYIMASSALPGLRSVKLDDQVYMDGGIGDNLPFDMLRRRGLHNIIAIDVRLALLMELMSDVKKNGSKWSIPLRLFQNMDQAADALLYLE